MAGILCFFANRKMGGRLETPSGQGFSEFIRSVCQTEMKFPFWKHFLSFDLFFFDGSQCPPDSLRQAFGSDRGKGEGLIGIFNGGQGNIGAVAACISYLLGFGGI
jgi:hypothetical protein